MSKTVVTDPKQLLSLDGNKFVGTPPAFSENGCSVTFSGSGNVLYCEEGVSLAGDISFRGNNSLIVLRKSRHLYNLNATVYNNSVLAFGSDNYFNGVLNIILSEERFFLVGDNCLFSFGIWVRTADPHLIYDIESHKRINPSKDIFIGDHVWIDQDVLLLKGSTIGSGSIIGAGCLLSSKRVHSNSSWGGVPASCLREGVFWDGRCVHGWTQKDTKKNKAFKSDRFVFSRTSETIDPKCIVKAIRSLESADARLEAVEQDFFSTELGNRFYLERESKKKRGSKLKKRICRFLGITC